MSRGYKPEQIISMLREANVIAVKASGIGDFRTAPSGEITLYMRPNPNDGLLAVSPSYNSHNKARPWKLTVTVLADTPAARQSYSSIPEFEIAEVLRLAMREMNPEFSVMGYMVRGRDGPPAMHFTIFESLKFPAVFALNKIGHVCPTEGGKKKCIRQKMIGAN